MPEVRINLPDDGTEFETVTQFAAYVAGGSIDSSTGGVKVPLMVSFEEKYDALKITDRPGETLFFIAFARKQLDHYGDDE